MLKKRASSRKKRWIVAPIAGVLTAAVIAGAMYDTAEVALAKASLPGIEEIVQSNGLDKPFKILELVADYPEASIGFLVDGEEPAYIGPDGVKSIADMASADERADRLPGSDTDYNGRFPAFSPLRDSGAGGAFTWENGYTESNDGDVSRITYGTFVNTGSGSDYKNTVEAGGGTVYKPVGTGAGDVTIKDVIDSTSTTPKSTGVLYADILNFNYADGSGSYDIVFGVANQNAGVTAPYRTLETNTDGDYYYNWQYYITENFFDAYHYEHKDAVIDPETGDVISDEEVERFLFSNAIPDSTGKDVIIYEKTVDTDGTDIYTRMGVIRDDLFTGTVAGTAYSGLELISLDVDSDPSHESLARVLADLKDSSNDVYLYTIREYDTNYESDAQRRDERLYVKTYVPGDLYEMSKTDKATVLISGQEASAYGIDEDDDLTYHTYFYVPADAAAYEYAPGDPNSEYTFVQDYSSAMYEEYKYTNGLLNNEWFKKYVLDREDDECANTIVQVDTKKYSEVSTDDIDEADLIYIRCSGDYTVDSAIDISPEAAKRIIESMKDNKAIILENKTLYENLDASADDMRKLSIILGQGDLSDDAIDGYIADYDTADYVALEASMFNHDDASKATYTNRTLFVIEGNTINKLFNDESGIKDDTYKLGNVTVSLQDVKDDIKNELFYLQVNGVDKSTFNAKLTIATCIRHILNFGDRRIISKDSLRILDLEPYYSQRVEDRREDFFPKDKIQTVRDLFDDNWFVTNVTDTVTKDKLSIERQGIKEFVGSIKDLNENYDLIYIGLDTQYFNTDAVDSVVKTIETTETYISGYEQKQEAYTEREWQVWHWVNVTKYRWVDDKTKPIYSTRTKTEKVTVKKYETRFNTQAMNGRVYFHHGDVFNVNGGNNDEMGLNGNYRMSGLDLTFEKTRELKEFIEAGYSVIVSDDFFKVDASGNRSVNYDRITEDSYMADLGRFIIGEKPYEKSYYGKNVRSKSDFIDVMSDDDKDDFASYLSISKLYARIVDDNQPTSYFNGYDTAGNPIYNYLDQDRDGKYYLNYLVELENKSELATATYDCWLYIDGNADGRYTQSEGEGLRSSTIITEEDSSPVGKYFDTKNQIERFTLQTGKKYRISVAAEGVVGYVPWKLVFTENDNENVRFAIQGACAIPDSSNKPTIKVLQITSGARVNANLNASRDQTNGGNPATKGASNKGVSINGSTPNNNMPYYDWVWYGTNLDLANTTSNINGMKPLYDKVNDFNIVVDKISAYDFVYDEQHNFTPSGQISARQRTEAMIDYLHGYDMVVMGLTEAYYYPYKSNDQAPSFCGMYALREYILAGNSVLFSHDLTTNHTKDTENARKRIGWFANRYLLDVQGMDRFDLVGTATNNRGEHYLDELSRMAGMGNTCTLPEYKSKYDTPDYNPNIVTNAHTYWTYNTIPTGIDGNARSISEGVAGSRLLRYNQSSLGEVGVSAYKALGAANNAWGDSLKMTSENGNNGGNNSNTIYIRKLNSGQITEYPFHLKDDGDIIVANTHPQFHQLNLDTDSRDENDEDDVVVWYTIANQVADKAHVGYYTVNYNDARNNYYIYNKGNITYTGAGHSFVGETKEAGNTEKELFINTLVAAYNAGAHAPRAVFKDKPDRYGVDIKAIYEPYDMDVNASDDTVSGEVVGSDIAYNFKVVNTNLKNTYMDGYEKKVKKIYAQYYIEVPAESAGAIKIADTWYRVLSEAEFKLTKRTDASGNDMKVELSGDDRYVLDNNCIYQVELDTNTIIGNNYTENHTYADGKTVAELRKPSYKVYVRLSLEQDANVRGNMSTSLDSLPSTDSIEGLSISFTDLYELK